MLNKPSKNDQIGVIYFELEKHWKEKCIRPWPWVEVTHQSIDRQYQIDSILNYKIVNRDESFIEFHIFKHLKLDVAKY